MPRPASGQPDPERRRSALDHVDGAVIRVVVIGGGLVGCATAFALTRRGVAVTLLEGSARLGGAIGSVRAQGFLAESGPHVAGTGPALDRLVAELGLEAARIVAPARLVVARDGALVPLPTRLAALIGSPLLSAEAKFRVLREPWVAPRGADDESVAGFTRRRGGQEVLDYIVEPLVSAIYAGDPERLSLAHTLPDLAALEREHGSVRRALREITVVSFRDGMQMLVDALAGRLGDAVHTSSPVTAVRRDDATGRWTVDAGLPGRSVSVAADAVVCALPAYAVDGFAWPDSVRQRLTPILGVTYASVAVLTLGFRASDVTRPLTGLGVLVPSAEPFSILGAMCPSAVFPDRAPPDHVTIAAFVGGARRPELATAPLARQRVTALNDLRELLGLKGEPVFERATTWAQGIPQLDLGYGRVRAAAADIAEAHPGLFLTGSYLTGITVDDGIAGAEALAEHIYTSPHVTD